MSEEHKRKIGLANSIALKGKHTSPKTEFKKGMATWCKGKSCPQLQGENHYKWKGGTHATARRIAYRYGFDMTKCQICKKKGKVFVHHIDENPYNNNLNNLRILCPKCHNELHGIGLLNRFQKGHKRNEHGGNC